MADIPTSPNTFTVGGPESGQRLDAYLSKRLGVGRTQIKRLLAAGDVRVQGRRVGEKDKSLFLAMGQVVEVTAFDRPEAQQVVPRPDLPLSVLSVGDGWVVVDKPAGMAVHPLEAGETDTLLNAVVARHPEMQGVGEGGLRSGVVHRLDVDTSGALLFATEAKRWHHLRHAFREHRTQKLYRAIVLGKLHGSEEVTLDLVMAQHSPARVKVVDPIVIPKPAGTRRCQLSWRSVASVRGGTLVEIDLGTGFLHQIRVMMAHIGAPVLGDPVYTPTGTWKPIEVPRQMLHASWLKVGDIEARSPDPADFVQAMDALRKY
jgi:23S rRNA pseudouridine1911/1915/1917 synthase